MKFQNSTYDWMKWLVMLFLPALASLITAVGAIWGIPSAGQIADTIVAINAALAAMLGISTINYQREKDTK